MYVYMYGVSMRIFYTASFYGKQAYQEQYDLVRATIKEFSVDLISPEEGNYLDVIDPKTRKRLEGKPKLIHYEAIRQGIHLADAVIIEATHEDIQLGHEVTLALMEKKPMLVLSTKEDFSKKIIHDYLFGARYTKATIKGILQDFFVNVRQMRHARRFNMFLYPSQVEYLEKISVKQGMNMSEYIRHLINLDRRSSDLSEK